MKSILVCLWITIMCHAVVSQPSLFPDSNGLWTIVWTNGSGAFITSYTQTLYTGGDSMLNGFDYKKIYTTPDTVADGGFVLALLRQDTMSSKVFCVSYRDTVERLLYDFDLLEGQSTIVYPAFFGGNSEVTVTVEEVDSVLISGQFRKRLRLDGWYSGRVEYWIEGVGSTEGILDAGLSGYAITDVWYPYLQCYLEDGDILYKRDFADKCFIALPSGFDDEYEESSLTIYPNPAFDDVVVHYSRWIDKILVQDVLGRLVLSKEIGAINAVIDISSLSQGLYYFTVVSKNRVSMKKVIKYGS